MNSLYIQCGKFLHDLTETSCQVSIAYFLQDTNRHLQTSINNPRLHNISYINPRSVNPYQPTASAQPPTSNQQIGFPLCSQSMPMPIIPILPHFQAPTRTYKVSLTTPNHSVIHHLISHHTRYPVQSLLSTISFLVNKSDKCGNRSTTFANEHKDNLR